MRCKITNKSLKPFMSFGKMPIANGFLKEKDFKNEFFFNMEIGFNEEISLFQLNDHPKPEKMFNENYPFFTSSSNYMKTHFKEYSKFVKKFLKTGSKIIEIGSNDGTFLSNFYDQSENIIGIEPSKNVADLAKKKGIPTLNKFFNKPGVESLKNYIGKTDLICASNVVCHVPDLNGLIETVDYLLSKNGTFIFEEPYLGSMFEKVSYDQIYDEHIFIFSANSVSKIFERYDFELIDVYPQITHGGSMRYVVKRKNKNKNTRNLSKVFNYEKKSKLDRLESCLKFKENCEASKEKTISKIKFIKESKKSISGYAATSKSTTILNYCGIDNKSIDFICDTTPEKIGKFSPGMHIPIVDMNYFHNNITDSVYLFAWNHKDEILKKEKDNKVEWFSHVEL